MYTNTQTQKPSSPLAKHHLGQSKSHDDIIDLKPKWNDVWALILYWVNLGLTIGLAIRFGPYAIQALRKSPEGGGSKDVSDLTSLFTIPWILTGLCAGVSVSVAFIAAFITLLITFPRQMIKGSFYISAAFHALSAIGALVTLGSNGLIFCLIGFLAAGLTLLCLYFWKSRIPFSAVLLQTVVDVLKQYPSVYALQALGFLVNLAYTSLLAFMLLGISEAQASSGLSSESASVYSTYAFFSFAWSSQIFRNIVHTSVAGLMATFYFLHSNISRVPSPVWRSFSRSMTTSFGSIAFGSLIVAVIQTLRYLARRDRRRGETSIVAVIFDCLLGIVESLAEYFNYYAYIQVAIYGKPYIQAAKDTFQLIKRSGIEAIINDSLIDTVLFMTTLGIAIFSGASTLFILLILGAHPIVAIVLALVALVFAVTAANIAFQTISSAVSATFVCLAEDAAALQRTKPELYATIAATYPGVSI
jgi:plasma-membrane choline transporter